MISSLCPTRASAIPSERMLFALGRRGSSKPSDFDDLRGKRAGIAVFVFFCGVGLALRILFFS